MQCFGVKPDEFSCNETVQQIKCFCVILQCVVIPSCLVTATLYNLAAFVPAGANAVITHQMKLALSHCKMPLTQDIPSYSHFHTAVVTLPSDNKYSTQLN